MPVQLSVDRFEGRDEEVAVLVSDEGASFDVPRAWLPPEAKPGDVVTLNFQVDPDAGRKIAEQAKALQDEIQAADSGGDLVL